MIARVVCFFNGCTFTRVDVCSRCQRWLSYEALVAGCCNSLPERVLGRWRDVKRALRRRRERRTLSSQLKLYPHRPCEVCGEGPCKTADDCFPF